MTTICVNGAAGRMGRRLVALGHEDRNTTVVGALETPGHELLGQDAGNVSGCGPIGVAMSDHLSGPDPQVAIDFTVPAATRSILRLAVERNMALVIGTTGLSDDDHAAIDDTARSIPVLQAPNMSVGVNLLFALAGQAAAKLGEAYDIEVVEAHHRFKIDAPSGTALSLAKAICDATGRDLSTDVVHGRHGADARRAPRQIGMHALRLGDVVGRHTASFAALGEELQLTHIASNRDVFAQGALRAAHWLADGKAPGRYGMPDVLGL